MFIVLIYLIQIFNQQLGNFYSKKYTSEVYDAHEQNWAIVINQKNYVYVANGKSLLRYDGSNWDKLTIPNQTVNSLLLDTLKNKIYVGGTSEFGYIDLNNPLLSYKSISDSLVNINGRIHKIHILKEELIFNSPTKLISISKTDTAEIAGSFIYSFLVSDHIFIQKRYTNNSLPDYGVYQRLSKRKLRKIIDGKDINNESVINIFQKGDIFYLFTYQGNIYTYDLTNLTIRKHFNLPSKNLLKAKLIGEKIFVATRDIGFLELDWNFKVLRHLSSKNTLLSDFINDLCFDKNQNLWLATNEGIEKIELNTGVTFIDKSEGIKGLFHKAILYNGKLYIATSDGLYRQNDHGAKYLKLYNSYTWDLVKIKKKLYLASTEGVFSTSENGRKTKIDDTQSFSFLHNGNDLYIAQRGFVKHLNVETNKLKTIITQVGVWRYFNLDNNNNLWVGSDDTGMIRVHLLSNTNQHFYTKPFNTGASIPLTIDGKFLLKNKDTFYTHSNDTFSPFKIKKDKIKFFQSFQGKEYYYKNNELFIKTKHSEKKISLKRFGTKQINSISEINKHTVISRNGDLLFIDSNKKINTDFNIQIRSVQFTNMDLEKFHQPKEIPYSYNNLFVEVIAPYYIQEEKVAIEFKLEPTFNKWIANDYDKTIRLNGLSDGNYTLKIRGKNVFNTYSNEVNISFTILTPWYVTIWAYLVYLLLSFIIVYTVIQFVIRYKLRKANELLRLEKAESRAMQVELNAKIKQEKIRTRIASDLHDEIGGNLGSISLKSQLLIKHLSLHNKEEYKLQKIYELALKSAKSMREIVWFIDPDNINFDKLVIKMKEEAKNIIDHLSYTFECQVDSFETDLGFSRNFFLFYKEVLQNIIKHSKATQVNISINQSNNELCLSIKDNGTGFNMDEQSNGNGLKNYQIRANSLTGRYFIESEKQVGTHVSLYIKLP